MSQNQVSPHFPSTKLHALEYRLLQRLQAQGDSHRWPGRKILLACSGGADSVALAKILSALAPRLEFEWALAHVHHGPDTTGVRDRAEQFVTQLAARLQVRCFTLSATSDVEIAPQSEAALRKFRLAHLERWRKDGAFTHLAFAHHADDLYETRLIRLIRGTGLGGLKAMVRESETRLRPLLEISRADLREYLSETRETWAEDPTNVNGHYLRNWLRNEWLPQLEKKRPGSIQSLARSLNLIARGTLDDGRSEESTAPSRTVAPCLTETAVEEWSLDLGEWQKLDATERESRLASHLRRLLVTGRIEEFTREHVLEISKRLDSKRKVHRFNLLGLTWEVIDGRLRIS